ncbi:MAG: PucR family transcriptional regulator [Coriobacteriales bacterium]|jgi:hypothetical protein
MSGKIDELCLAIYHEIVKGGGVQAVITATSKFFDNPISVSNAGLEPVAHYPEEDTGDEFWERHNSPDIAKHYDLELNFESSGNQVGPKPKIFEFPEAEHRIMTCTATSDGKVYGYVLLLEFNHALDDEDASLLEQLSYAIGYLISQSNQSVKNPRLNKNLIFKRLVEDKFVPKEIVSRYLADNDPDKRFSIVVFEGTMATGKKESPEYRTRIFEQALPQYPVCIVDGRLSALLHGSFSSLSPGHVKETLSPLIEKRGWKCGVSNPFYSIFKAAENFRMACSALEVGQQVFPNDANVYFYNSIAFASFLEESGQNYDLNRICDPVFKFLMHYDNDHGTPYFRTLVVFASCRMNMKESAQILNLHRSTLQYRLDKILEVTGNDELFNDPFRLELSVRVMYSLSPVLFEQYKIPAEKFAYYIND